MPTYRITYSILIMLIISFTACSSVENATVKVHTGLNNVQATASPVTLFDKVLHFFSNEAVAAPIGVTEITVLISGPDMNDIIVPYPAAETLVIVMPPGSDRKIGLIAPSASGDIYAGSVTTDLSPGEIKDVSISMGKTMNYLLSSEGDYLEPCDIAVYGNDVYIAGIWEDSTNGFFWLIKKINSNNPGALDSDFTGTGDTIVSGSNPAYAYAVSVDEQYVYIAGTEVDGMNFNWRVEKRDRISGDLVSGFGTGGIMTYTVDSGLGSATPRAIAHDDNFLYIGGTENFNGGYNWRLEKRNKSDGAPDTGFMSGDGFLTFIDAHGLLFSDSGINSVALADGNIYAGGYFNDGGDEQTDWRIEKIGISASSYTTNWLTPPRFMGNSAINAIEVKDGCIYAAGSDDSQWRIEKYNADTGEYSNDFGENGVVTVNGPSYSYEATSLAVDERYIYVAGHEEIEDTDYAWRIEKRDRETGELVSEFGTNGMISFNPGTGSDEIRAIAVDDMFIYITGTDNSETYTSILIQKRLKRTGELTANP